MGHFVNGLLLLGAASSNGPPTATWTDQNICRAAIYAYFFLNEFPVYVGPIHGALGLSSGAGAMYSCRIQGDQVSISWRETEGLEQSASITATIANQYLAIQTINDMQMFEVGSVGVKPVE